MRDQGGSLDERAFGVLVVLPLRYRSCIFANPFPLKETIIVVRSSNSGGVVERRIQGPVNQ
jgi:hypothetical protein